MTKPEELPHAPSPILDPLYAIDIMEEAERKSYSVQWGFTISLVFRAGKWGVELEQDKYENNLSPEEIQAYLVGFTLPLFCLQAARIVLDEGKKGDIYKEFLGYLIENDNVFGINTEYAINTIGGTIDLCVENLQIDPSGLDLLQTINKIYKLRGKKHPKYFIKGIDLCVSVYESYWHFFSQYEKELVLW